MAHGFQARDFAMTKRQTRHDDAGELATLRQRVAELEGELAGARKTIHALLERTDEHAQVGDENVAIFEAAARLERAMARRTGEVEEKSQELEKANAELRDLTDNLDKIVRQRTRALIESEAQLRRKNEELKRLNQTKREFISIAAHELRTPLTSMVGYLDLVHEGRFGRLPPPVTRPMASVRRNAHRLRRLVDEMLDVSRIEADRMVLKRVDVSLGQICQEVVEELRPLADTKRQQVSANVDGGPSVFADEDKIHQVVANLITNAIRYTPQEGAIDVLVDEAPEDRYPGEWARLRVRDNGIGIAPQHIDRIFEPFSDVLNTAKHHTSAGPDSAGLGLYIARGIVDLHGGIITVESDVGQGTEFTILLPKQQAA